MRKILIIIALIVGLFPILSANSFSEDRKYIVSKRDTFFHQDDIDKIEFRVENAYKSNDKKFYKYEYVGPQKKVRIELSNFSYNANSEINLKEALASNGNKIKAERGMVVRNSVMKIKGGEVGFMIFKTGKNYGIMLISEAGKNTFSKAVITTNSFKNANFKKAFSMVLSDMDYPKFSLGSQKYGHITFDDFSFLKSKKVLKYNDVFVDNKMEILDGVNIIAENRTLLESDLGGKNVVDYLAQLQKDKSKFSLSYLAVEENSKGTKYIISKSTNNKKDLLKSKAKYLTEVTFIYEKKGKIELHTLNFFYSNKIYDKKIAEILSEINITGEYPFYLDTKNIKIGGNYAKNSLENFSRGEIVAGEFDFTDGFCSVDFDGGASYGLSPCKAKRTIIKSEEDQNLNIYLKSNIRNADFGYKLTTKGIPEFTIYSGENAGYSRGNVYLRKKIKSSTLESGIHKGYINIEISDFKTNKTKNLRVYLEFDVK